MFLSCTYTNKFSRHSPNKDHSPVIRYTPESLSGIFPRHLACQVGGAFSSSGSELLCGVLHWVRPKRIQYVQHLGHWIRIRRLREATGTTEASMLLVTRRAHGPQALGELASSVAAHPKECSPRRDCHPQPRDVNRNHRASMIRSGKRVSGN